MFVTVTAGKRNFGIYLFLKRKLMLKAGIRKPSGSKPQGGNEYIAAK